MAMGVNQDPLRAAFQRYPCFLSPFFERLAGLSDPPRVALQFTAEQVWVVIANGGVAAGFNEDDRQPLLNQRQKRSHRLLGLSPCVV